MTELSRREWMERIRQHVACMAALTMSLLGGWSEMTNEDKQKELENIKGEMDTILVMIRGRFMFNGKDEHK